MLTSPPLMSMARRVSHSTRERKHRREGANEGLSEQSCGSARLSRSSHCDGAEKQAGVSTSRVLFAVRATVTSSSLGVR